MLEEVARISGAEEASGAGVVSVSLGGIVAVARYAA